MKGILHDFRNKTSKICQVNDKDLIAMVLQYNSRVIHRD